MSGVEDHAAGEEVYTEKRMCYFFEKHVPVRFGSGSPAIRFTSLSSVPAPVRFRLRRIVPQIKISLETKVNRQQGKVIMGDV